MAEPLLAYDDVEISYRGVPVVRGVSLTVSEGEVTGLVGESGSGKSTLLKAAMGLLGHDGSVTAGDIRYEGRSLPDLPSRELRALCGRELALIFQDSLSALTPIRTIGDQVHEALRAHGRLTRAASDGRAAEIFERLGLDRQVLESYPFELSGGMGQRVGIALALLGRPRVLLADEPTSALDVIAQAQVMDLLAKVREATGVAMVLVTHNMAVARRLATSVVVLRHGRVVESGQTAEVLDHPQEDYTRALIAATPRLER